MLNPGRPMNKAAAIAALLGGLGTNGDTVAGHLTPGEMVIPKGVIDNDPALMSSIIKAFGKAGKDWRPFMVDGPKGGDDKRNPMTAMPAYYEDSPGDTQGDTASSSHSGSDADTSGGGQSGMDQAAAGQAAFDASNAAMDQASRDALSQDQAAARGWSGDTYSASQQYGETGTWGDSSMSASDAMKLGLPTEMPTNLKGWIDAALASGMTGGTTGAGLRGAAALAGPAITGAIESLFGTTATHNRGVGYDYSTPEDKGPGAGGTPALREAATEVLRKYNRPEETPAPSFLSVSGMTSPQARSYVATQATQGNDARFRDPETWKFYVNNLMRDLVSDTGTLGQYSSVLPVEHQFLGQRGLSYDPTVGSLLDAISAS